MATAAIAALSPLVDALIRVCGAEHVLTDPTTLRFYATDVFNSGELPVAVVRPATADDVQRIVKLCFEAGAPVITRGGGASYTDGYLHTKSGGVTIDTSRMDRIVEINETNGTVTVEPGCTWAALHEALKARGLRTPFWGPFSGLAATVGGTVSQNGISHGTGAYGVSAESVVALEVITGTGESSREIAARWA
jgi:glycolate oxidase